MAYTSASSPAARDRTGAAIAVWRGEGARGKLLVVDSALGWSLPELGDRSELDEALAELGVRARYLGTWHPPPITPQLRCRETFVIELDSALAERAAARWARSPGACWIAIAEVDDALATGRRLFHPLVVRAVEFRQGRSEAVGDASRVWPIAAGIACVPVRTPTLPPATHTNCYLLGDAGAIAIDPASPYPDEQQALADAIASHLGSRPLEAIVLTHHHPDHVGGAADLAARWSVPILAHPRTAALVKPAIAVDRELDHGSVLTAGGRRVRCLYTPGHAPGHLCLADEATGMIVAGDMVAGVGTIVIDPDEGDMSDYLASLEQLAARAPTALLPAHGAPIAAPADKLREYVEHRLWRERRVYEALDRVGHSTARGLVAAVYDDVAVALHPLAERSLLSHLRKLERDGRAAVAGEHWSVTS